MARSHISYDDMELGILRVALSDFILRSHEAARALDSSENLPSQDQRKARERQDAYRRQADRADAMVKRMKQGYRGLQEVK